MPTALASPKAPIAPASCFALDSATQWASCCVGVGETVQYSGAGGRILKLDACSELQADTPSLSSKDLPSVPEHTSGQPQQPLPCGHLDNEPEWEIPASALSLGTVLGEGEFGIVHKGRWNGTPVAIKVLRLPHTPLPKSACSVFARLAWP